MTAFLTLSTSSLLCSKYSVSSNRCFFPATWDGSPLELGPASLSMPSLRSSASNLARWASAAALLRAGSCSKYSASLCYVHSSSPTGADEWPERAGKKKGHATHFFASLMVLRRRPLRSRHESLLLVFWLLMRPPAARSCEPKPPLPPRKRGTRRRVIRG